LTPTSLPPTKEHNLQESRQAIGSSRKILQKLEDLGLSLALSFSLSLCGLLQQTSVLMLIQEQRRKGLPGRRCDLLEPFQSEAIF
jgi:hypothetical protein